MSSLLFLFACAFNDDSSLADSEPATSELATVAAITPDPGVIVAPDAAVREGCPIAKAMELAATAPAPAPLATPDDTARADRWLTRHGIQYLGQHRMDRGETAWELSRAIGVPVWVLRSLNQPQDLDHLHVADWIVYPVTTENAEAAEGWYTEEECGC